MIDSTTLEFKQFAAQLRSEIDRQLDAYAQFDADCPERLRAAIRHSLLSGGKRLRPILVLSAAEACGSDLQKAMPAACAIEMVHTYSLIHDDLPAMDDDELRRGQPTCHVAFDEATAILAGDALQARAFEIMGRDLKPATAAARCCVELAFAAGASQMVGGQADDLASEKSDRSGKEPAESQRDDEESRLKMLNRIHARKTGAMLTAALRLGALTAEANSEQLSALTAYGRKLGLAFQIVDDLLDMTGDVAEIGKNPGQDAQHGKLTFPSVLGIDASRARASTLIEESIQQLVPFGSRASKLDAIARFVLERNS